MYMSFYHCPCLFSSLLQCFLLPTFNLCFMFPSVFCSIQIFIHAFLYIFLPPLWISPVSPIWCASFIFSLSSALFFASFLSFHSSIHLLIPCAKRQHAGDEVGAYMETTEEKWADVLLLIDIRLILLNMCTHSFSVFLFWRNQEVRRNRNIKACSQKQGSVHSGSEAWWWVSPFSSVLVWVGSSSSVVRR